MITGLTVAQLKALVFLKNTKPDQYGHITDIISMLANQNIDALKGAVDTQQMFKSQGAIYTLEELLDLLNDPNTTLARLEE
jgi:hypothetical protein